MRIRCILFILLLCCVSASKIYASSDFTIKLKHNDYIYRCDSFSTHGENFKCSENNAINIIQKDLVEHIQYQGIVIYPYTFDKGKIGTALKSKNCDNIYKHLYGALIDNVPVAYKYYGIMYDYGICVDQDFTKAINNYEKSGESGGSIVQARISELERLNELKKNILNGEIREENVSRESIATNKQDNKPKEDNHLLGNIDQTRINFSTVIDTIPTNDLSKTTVKPNIHSTKEVASSFNEFDAIKKLAKRGVPEAQFTLGLYYADGDGVKKDLAEAKRWFNKAANKGHEGAQLALGLAYANDDGNTHNSRWVADWFEEAAGQGIPEAMYYLGLAYVNGNGVTASIRFSSDRFREAARHGMAEAQYFYGLAILSGGAYASRDDDTQNSRIATKYFQEAANQGHAEAQDLISQGFSNLGDVYSRYHAEADLQKYGEVLKRVEAILQSYKEPAKWYYEAIELGHAEAQYALGEFYAKCEEGPKLNYKAFKWYKKAASQGHVMAQRAIGELYYNGSSKRGDLLQNFKAAAEWYRKAAEQGDAMSQYYLGRRCYFYGKGVTKDKIEAAKWIRKAAEQGHAEAKEIFDSNAGSLVYLAEQGHADAQRTLGENYYHGKGVKKNLKEAVKWYRKAAEQGDAISQYHLGMCYSNEVLRWEYEQGVKWYSKAAEQGHADAQYALAECYAEGVGVTQNFSEAIEWYRKAAENGHTDAQNYLGMNYAKGVGVTQDYEAAISWFRKAADQGHTEAISNLRNYSKEFENMKAFQKIKKAAEQGLADAQYNLGNYYFDGKIVDQDRAKAVKWYRKAAKQGNADAQSSLGSAYFFGNGIGQNPTKAFKWYHKAAKQGHVHAQVLLGGCYLNGTGTNQNYKKAVKWFRKAADQEDTAAQYGLGLCYNLGYGVAEDLTEANKWYRKAAEQGWPEAQYTLGRSFAMGSGVTQDYQQAIHWLNKAAEQGHEEAKVTLKKLEPFDETNALPYKSARTECYDAFRYCLTHCHNSPNVYWDWGTAGKEKITACTACEYLLRNCYDSVDRRFSR